MKAGMHLRKPGRQASVSCQCIGHSRCREHRLGQVATNGEYRAKRQQRRTRRSHEYFRRVGNWCFTCCKIGIDRYAGQLDQQVNHGGYDDGTDHCARNVTSGATCLTCRYHGTFKADERIHKYEDSSAHRPEVRRLRIQNRFQFDRGEAQQDEDAQRQHFEQGQ